MRSLKLWSLFLILLSMTLLARGQVVPAAGEGSARLAVGGAMSIWNVDWGSATMLGYTGWVDGHPSGLNRLTRLNGLGLEGEIKDIGLARPAGKVPSNFSELSFAGGPIYNWDRSSNFHPYAKFMVGWGKMNFSFPNIPGYTSDSSVLYAMGGGINYRIHKALWVRADYEYQTWDPMFRSRATPQGITIGAMYDIRRSMAQ